MQRNSGELGGPGCPLSPQSGQPAVCPGQAHVCRAPADPPQERSLVAERESVPEGKDGGAWGSADTCRSSTEESSCPGKPSEDGMFSSFSNTFVYPSQSFFCNRGYSCLTSIYLKYLSTYSLILSSVSKPFPTDILRYLTLNNSNSSGVNQSDHSE